MTYILEENTPGFCGVEGTIDTNHGGFTGSGFANTDNSNGTGIDYAVTVPAGGFYRISFRYANGASARSGTLTSSDLVLGDYAFSGTGAWATWATSPA